MKRSARDPKYLAVLAVAATTILVLGSWLRPDGDGEEGSSQVLAPDSSLSQLPRLTQRRAIEDRVEFVTQSVASLDRYIFWLDGAGQSAVLWNAATLVTSLGTGRAPSRDSAYGASADQLAASVDRAGPHLPLSLLGVRLERPALPLRRLAASSSPEGSWVLAAWRGADGSLAWSEGQYLRTRRENCGDLMPAQTLASTVSLEPQMAGAGVFNIDGALVGIVGRCDDGLAILSTQAIELLFGRTRDLADRLLYRFGMGVDLPSDGEREALRAEKGLLVREVWDGYQGYAAGLRPGDVILSIDGVELVTVDELEKLVLPVAQEIFELQVLSQRRRPRKVELKARPEVEPALSRGGVILTDGEQGIPIAYVASEGGFASARAQAGDHLLSIDGRVFENPQEVEQYLERATGAAWATLRRGDRVWGALLSNE
jgi:serine protease DegQ